jgi:hypothetical protein
MPYSLKCTNVSEDPVASIIKVDEDGNDIGNKGLANYTVSHPKRYRCFCIRDFFVIRYDTALTEC